jgi:hypothetical protein
MRERDATPISVIAGETTEIVVRVPVRKPVGGSIEGLVVTENEGQLDIAIVTAISVNATNVSGDAALMREYSTITDPDGRYTIEGLPDGHYIVRARAPYHAPVYYEHTFDPSKATVLEVRDGGVVTGINIKLLPVYYAREDDQGAFGPGPAAGTIFGTVTGPDGAPIAGAMVYVLSDTGDVVAYVETLLDGSYRVEGLIPNGDYRVQANNPGFEGQFNGGVSDFSDAEPLVWTGQAVELNFSMESSAQTGSDSGTEPTAFRLLGNYPNPFNPSTTIRFSLSERAEVTIRVFDTLGREVARLDQGVMAAGVQSVGWTARGATGQELPSGIYLYRVIAGDQMETGRFVLSR